MEDWDNDQRRAIAAVRPVRVVSLVLAGVALVLVAVVLGAALRGSRPATPFAAPAATAGDAVDGGEPTVDAGRDAAVEKAAEILLGGGGLDTSDPNALNLSPGQAVTLRNPDAEVEVTPGRVTAGTGGCADGPLLTVALSVRMTRGWADLAPGDFTLLGSDASAVHAAEACSAGFTEAADERTLVFTAGGPGRLAYGPDPDHPVAMWQLS